MPYIIHYYHNYYKNYLIKILDMLIRHVKRLFFIFFIQMIAFGLIDEFKRILHKPDTIRNLVFEGGGIKGLAYVGALEKSLEKNVFSFDNIQNIAGTSAGAITAVLVGLNYSINEIKSTLESVQFEEFLDSDFKESVLDLKKELNENRPTINLLLTNFFFFKKAWYEFNHSFGLFPGVLFRDWIEEKINAKLGIRDATFKDLEEKILNGSNFKFIFLTGSNLITSKAEVFSHLHTPDMIIADAVRISMSLPILFYPHYKFIKNKKNERVIDQNRDPYVDGGLLNNYPIRIFDTKEEINNIEKHYINMETLGFRLVTNEQKSNYENSCKNEFITNAASSLPFIIMLFNVYHRREEILHSKSSFDKKRTVYIDSLDISTLDFDLTKEKKENLIESGRNAVNDYILKKKSFETNNLNSTYLRKLFKAIWNKKDKKLNLKCNHTKKVVFMIQKKSKSIDNSIIHSVQKNFLRIMPQSIIKTAVKIISSIKKESHRLFKKSSTELLTIYFLLFVILFLLLIIFKRFK